MNTIVYANEIAVWSQCSIYRCVINVTVKSRDEPILVGIGADTK